MAAKIRLSRMGRKKKPFYRIVVTDESFKQAGRVSASLGYYDATVTPAKLHIDKAGLQKWLSVGAQPTEAIRKLLLL